MTSSGISRRVAGPEDAEFLRLLFIEVRSPEFAAAGMSSQQIQALLNQQYTAMRTHYARAFPTAVIELLERDGLPIGATIVQDGEEILLIDISLIGSARNQGIGTRFIQYLQAVARRKGKRLTLHVEHFNPARRLYDRLGFRPIQEDGIYTLMHWNG